MEYKKHNAEVLNSLIENGTADLATSKGHKLTVDVRNAAGYEQQISTLTQIKAEIVDQIVYGENLSDFANIGSEGGYADSITYFTEESIGDEDGVSSSDGINGLGNNVDFSRELKTAPIGEWKKGYDVTDTQMEQAMLAGNRSAIVSLERSFERMKKVYLNKRFFAGEGQFEGLLTLSSVAIDITTMPLNISGMTQAQINAFVSDIYDAFRQGNGYTVHATHFKMPSSEHTKLSKIYSEFYAMSVLEVIRKAFAEVSGNSNFKLVSSLYSEAANRTSSAKNLYMLYNSATIRFEIPVDKEAIWIKGMDIRTDKKLRISSVYMERPQEALYFEPVA